MAKGSHTGKAHSAKKGQDQNPSNPILDDVILLAVLAFCILLFLSLFHLAGRIGNWINSFMFGIFGMVSYLVPVALFFAVAFYLSNRGKKVAWVKVGAAIVLVVILCCFASLLFTSDILRQEVRTFYAACQSRRTSGGLIGCIFAWLFLKSIGKVGTWVLLIVLLIIAVVLITERSFFKGVQKGSEQIYNKADEFAIRHKEKRRERQEQRREAYEREAENAAEGLRRTDKKFTGVMLDTALKPEKEPEEIPSFFEEDTEEVSSDGYSLKNEHSINVTGDGFVDDYVDEIGREKPKKKSSHKTNAMHEITMEEESDGTENDAAEDPAEKPAERSVKESGKKSAKSTASKPGSSSAARGDGSYVFPPLHLLEKGKKSSADSKAQLNETAEKLRETLDMFGVKARVTDISQGPTVTRYEVEPEAGVKVSKIVGLIDDIKLHMAATDIRIEAPIPGKSAVGIEVPNAQNSIVMFRDLLESDAFQNAESKISFAVGKDLAGKVVVSDIAKMPHALIAGATGSGKSVCINTLIMSILYKATPDEVKLILIDPKVVELSVYNGIPHLMIPVVTDAKKAAAALNWGVNEMMERYDKFAANTVRDLKGYNKKMESLYAEAKTEEEKEQYKPLPQIVIIVDELADLMMVASNEVETAICRLAQLARAAGIHLVLATQRPSVDVITGLIKNNMPCRIAFSVSSGTDSRTILDMTGAERLLGKGDMLFYPQGYPKPARIQGAYVSDQEVQAVVDFLSNHQEQKPDYSEIEEKLKNMGTSSGTESSSSENERDELYVEAGRFVIESDKGSVGNLQRRFKIGFNRAARIMDQLAEDEVVSKSEGTKPRQVLMSAEQFEQFVEEYV